MKMKYEARMIIQTKKIKKIKILKILTIFLILMEIGLIGNIVVAQENPTPPPEPTPPDTDDTSDQNDERKSIAELAGSKVLSISISSLDPDPPMAGEIAELRIGIENLGGYYVNDLTMEIIPEYPFELVPGESAAKNVGMIEGYKVDSTVNLKTVKYTLKINKDAPAGIYELKVKYYEKKSGYVVKSLFIDIKSRANVEVIHIDKTSLIPGRQGSLKFTINNAGNSPLRDVTFYWENKDNTILPVGSDNTRNIKYIDVNSQSEIEYQVIADSSALPGLYKLDLFLAYLDSSNGTKKQLSTIAGMYVGGQTDFDISFSDNTNTETSFSIANTGSNPAYAVSIIIPKQTNWKVSGPNSVMIGNLNSGDYTVAGYKLRPLSNSTSQITVHISYTDTLGERKIVTKDVELDTENIKNTEIITDRGGGNTVQIIIILMIIVILIWSYKKYKEKKRI